MTVQGLVRVSTGFGASPKRLFEMVTTSDQTTFEAAGVTRSELPAGTRDTDLVTVYGDGFTQTYQANISNAGAVTLTQAHGVGTGSAGSGATTFAALTDIPANAAGTLTNDGSGNLTWSPAGAGYTTTDFTNDLAATNTDALSEGSTNLYYTDARFDAQFMLSSILGLSDTPLTFGAAGTVLKVNAAGTALEFGSASDGPTAVNSLANIPDPTTLQAGETYLVVNDATPALNGLYQVDGTIPGAGVGVSRVPA